MLIKMIRKVISVFFSILGNLQIRDKKGPITCGGFCRFTSQMKVGSNCHFNGMIVRKGGSLEIGNNFHSGWGCEVITANHNINGSKLPYDEKIISKHTFIEDNVWLGCKVLILPGVHIGEGAVIQAGSVVSSDIPALSVAGGNPAKVFKTRDIDLYFQLKREKKFL